MISFFVFWEHGLFGVIFIHIILQENGFVVKRGGVKRGYIELFVNLFDLRENMGNC